MNTGKHIIHENDECLLSFCVPALYSGTCVSQMLIRYVHSTSLQRAWHRSVDFWLISFYFISMIN